MAFPFALPLPLLLLVLVPILVISTPASAHEYPVPSSCRCFPGDACWPSPHVWDAFNASLGGKLIANAPIASVCHGDGYDASRCAALRDSWFLPRTHSHHPSSMMAALPTNNSCNPFLDAATPCAMGNYPVFTVNATGADDYVKTIRFSQAHNLRLVIRNTAADYNGKSSGAGALALWTHHLKTKELRHYDGSSYSGKAFRFGAGVEVAEAYEFAHRHGHVVVGANVAEVGLVGGYSQGAGTGPLVSRFGLGVDQVLEWEAVLASGETVTASPDSEHASLYWALCGGGGGTYAAVVSATVKAHPSLTLSTANLTFSAPRDAPRSFWDAVHEFVRFVPTINDAGAESVWYVSQSSFNLATVFAPGFTQVELDALMQPFVKALNRLHVQHVYASEQHPSFLDGFQRQPGTNVSNLNIGGRLIPRSLIDTNSEALTAAIRGICSSGAVFSGVTFNVSAHDSDRVSVNPYWREAAINAVFGFFIDWKDWEANWRSADAITAHLVPQLTSLTPNGAAYVNEYDFQEPDWERTLYGASWERLRDVKARYDADGDFYALGSVGSKGWAERHDGRLCRV